MTNDTNSRRFSIIQQGLDTGSQLSTEYKEDASPEPCNPGDSQGYYTIVNVQHKMQSF